MTDTHATTASSSLSPNTRSKSSSSRTARATEPGDKLSSSRDKAQNMTDTHATTASSSSSSANTRVRSPAKPTQQPKTPYDYTPIKDIKPGTSVNVFGVVKFVRPASRGRGIGESVIMFH